MTRPSWLHICILEGIRYWRWQRTGNEGGYDWFVACCVCRCSFFIRSFLVWILSWTVGFLPLPLTLRCRCVCVCVCVCSLACQTHFRIKGKGLVNCIYKLCPATLYGAHCSSLSHDPLHHCLSTNGSLENSERKLGHLFRYCRSYKTL